MGEHGSLGCPRGPRGVRDERHVVGLRRVERRRRTRCHVAGRDVAPDDLEVRRGHDDRPSAGALHHERPIGVVHDRRRGTNISDDMRELSFGVRAVHRDHDQARPQGSEVDDHRRAATTPYSTPRDLPVRARDGPAARPAPGQLVELAGPTPSRAPPAGVEHHQGSGGPCPRLPPALGSFAATSGPRPENRIRRAGARARVGGARPHTVLPLVERSSRLRTWVFAARPRHGSRRARRGAGTPDGAPAGNLGPDPGVARHMPMTMESRHAPAGVDPT